MPVRCEATRDARLERWTGITAVYSRAVVDSRCSLREVASSATIGSGARLGGVVDCEGDEDAIRLSYCYDGMHLMVALESGSIDFEQV